MVLVCLTLSHAHVALCKSELRHIDIHITSYSHELLYTISMKDQTQNLEARHKPHVLIMTVCFSL